MMTSQYIKMTGHVNPSNEPQSIHHMTDYFKKNLNNSILPSR